MIKVSTTAMRVALALGGASLIALAPASAQLAGSAEKKRKEREEAAAKAPQGQQGGQQFNLTKAERAALVPLTEAIRAQNWAAASAALSAAQSAAEGKDARYLVARSRMNIAIGTQNKAEQLAAIEAIIATGSVPAAELPMMYRNLAAAAQQGNDLRKAEAALTKWVELAPNDPDAIVALAENKVANRKPTEAVAVFERAIEARQASGQPVPEAWYKRGLRFAYESKMVPQSIKLGQGLISAYPTKVNWRDTLLIYRELNGGNKATNVDVMRLMRASGALSGERDYYELASTLFESGLPAESRAVLDEGVAGRMVDRNKVGFKDLMVVSAGKSVIERPKLAGAEAKARAAASGTEAMSVADRHLGYKDYAKAAEFYRLAAQKGGVDVGLANTRLGMALAMAGQKAEAEAAFRSVTGAHAGLAAYWMLWLNQRA